MDKDLIELIKNKLPEAEVGAVKSVLKELEDSKRKLVEMTNDIDILRKENVDLSSKLKEAIANNVAQDLIRSKEQDNYRTEQELNDKKLRLEAEVPKAREEVMKYMFDTIFKVPTTRENYQEKVMGYTSQYNSQTSNYQYSPSGESLCPVTKTITKE